jgi:transcriptional regulator with XRE-family HTH domain
MEILKTIRDQYGMSQQDMANLLGMTRDHYAMVETNRRILPPEPAKRFAALLPIFLENQPLPEMPEKVPESLQVETQRMLYKAQQDLYHAEQELNDCTHKIIQQVNRIWLTSQMNNLKDVNLTPRGEKLITTLAGSSVPDALTTLKGKWLLCKTRWQICKMAVDNYTRLLGDTQG